MAGGSRWPALAINPSAELQSDLSSLEGTVEQVNTLAAALQGQLDALSGAAAGHVLRSGDAMTGDLSIDGGAAALQLKPGESDHTYIELYARSSDPTTRSGLIGYPSAGSTDMRIVNTLGGVDFYTDGQPGRTARIEQVTQDVTRIYLGGESNNYLAYDEGSNPETFDIVTNDPNIGLRVNSNQEMFGFVNANVHETFPKGHIFDHGSTGYGGGDTLNAWPDNLFSATANVPAGRSVSILVWVWVRLDQSSDQRWSALDCTIGGSLLQNPALTELDKTTGSAGYGVYRFGGYGVYVVVGTGQHGVHFPGRGWTVRVVVGAHAHVRVVYDGVSPTFGVEPLSFWSVAYAFWSVAYARVV